MGRKVAIFGGTFNPVHVGHLVAAQDAHETAGADSTVWIPVAVPPHKASPDLASPDDRLRMLELAIRGDARFAIDDMEIARRGPSFSIDTVREWRRREPDAEIHFLIGSDSLMELHLWREIGALLESCRFITVSRPGFDPSSVDIESLKLPPAHARALLDRVIDRHPVPVSSSEIRARVAAGRSIRYLVPEAVRSWILERGLYR